MRRPAIIPTALFIAALLLGACQQNTARSQPITIDDAWARPGLSGENSAVYLTLKNNQNIDDTATGVESDAANMTQLHLSRMTEEGTMLMEHQESVPLPAASEVSFEPGGLHIMLMDLNQDLNPGDSISITLHFESAASITFEAEVREP